MIVKTHLEEDLKRPVHHAHTASHEGKEWDDEFDEVIGEGLKPMEPPWGMMHVVGHGVRNRLSLKHGTRQKTH